MAAILLLEDDLTLAEQIKAVLKSDGHTVAAFSTAKAALDYLDENDVECIIADLFIRVDGSFVQDGGITLISNVRQIQGRDIPVIAISGAFQNPNGEFASSSAITVGASANLAKPFHPDDLSSLVAQQLRCRQEVDSKSVSGIAQN